MSNRYLEALRRIPKGETRSFMELAAMAGRPGAARAAGRAVRACPADSRLPWHRVVAADGSLIAEDGQLTRLRREGARPREGEPVSKWAARRALAFVGKLPDRVYVPVDDGRAAGWGAIRVEPFQEETAALARGFRPADGELPTPIDEQPRRRRLATGSNTRALRPRLGKIDWDDKLDALESRGYFTVPSLLSPVECERILAESVRPGRFDRRVDMLAKGYGVGVYRYWKEPLPVPLGELQAALYDRLRPRTAYPPTLDGFRRRCRAAGQKRPSTILIQYPTGGVNHPHRDIYGQVWFPFQALVVLSRAGRDFEGGDFVLIEEHPDSDRRHAVHVSEGDLVVFGSRERLETRRGRRRKIPLLHAMDPVIAGEREAIGLVFHLAE